MSQELDALRRRLYGFEPAEPEPIETRVRELESILRDLLDVWDPESEPGKSLRQRALAALSET